MKVDEFLNRLYLAYDTPNYYLKGGWGKWHNQKWGWDCVCLIKGILWGWRGDKNKTHGGAKYASNGVPDYGTEKMISICNKVSNDFTNIEKGEMLWMKGHVGIYVGNNEVIEATTAWDRKIMKTKIDKKGNRIYNNQKIYSWKKHGFLPYINYTETNNYPGIFPRLPKRGYFKKGDKGLEVKHLQEFLNWSLNASLDVDGIIGSKTINKVKKFQKLVHIKDDGLFGKISLAKAKEFHK